MQTLSEQRKEIYENPDIPLCSSLALYALVERNPRPDDPDYAELACWRYRDNGMEGIVLCLSPIDAMIELRAYNTGGRRYEAVPYEAVNPAIFIRRHGGWFSLFILYGYAAHDNKLLLNRRGHPIELFYIQHLDDNSDKPVSVPESMP